MSRTLPLALVGLAASLAGCTISAVSNSGDQRPTNQCQSQVDCRSDQLCRGGLCQAAAGELDALLIEVTPPADSPVPSLDFTMHLEDVPTSGGELQLPPVLGARVTGNLHLTPTTECVPTFPETDGLLPSAADLTLPVTVTLIPRERLLGVRQQLYVTSSKYQLDADSPTYLSYSFETVVPLGEYDVYVVPVRANNGCIVPPQLFRRQSILKDKTELDYPASNRSTLELTLLWPRSETTLDGWLADIIEPLDGRIISSEAVLAGAGGDDQHVEYPIGLTYSTVSQIDGAAGSIEAAADLVRLRPPPGEPLPTIVFDRSVLGLLADGELQVKGFTRYPAPVTVVGQLAREDDGRPLQGRVRLVSTEITGVDAGVFAYFQADVDVGADDEGVFTVSMPPGRYRVLAVPEANSGKGLSALEAEWEVRAMVSPQAGRLLELRSDSSVRGISSFQDAEVEAAATPQTVLPFEEAFGAAPFTPRGQSGLVDASGRFALSLDPGRFNISLRAPDSLGFGWYVRPGVLVGAEERDLGRISLPAPSVVSGSTTAVYTVLDRDTKEVTPVTRPLPYASVRAYAYLDANFAYTSDREAAVSVVKVAETRSDDTGAFRLLIPSSLAAAR